MNKINKFLLVLLSLLLVWSCEEETEMPRLKVANELTDSVLVVIDSDGFFVRANEIVERNDFSPGLHNAAFIFYPQDTIGLIDSFPIKDDETAWLYITTNTKGDTVVYHQYEEKDLDKPIEF